jgi:transposase-like protein
MRRKRKGLTPDAPRAPVPSEILDQFVRQGPISPEELDAAVRRFKKAIIERALGGELTHHLGYPPGGTKPEDTTNHRNGTSGKTVLTDDGPLALAVLPDGSRDILGLWIEQTEGAKFWMKVFTDLKTRGCQDILIAVTDGLKGISDALAAVYPATTLQTCIVHLLRNSLEFANWKQRKPLAAARRPVYAAASAEAASAPHHLHHQRARERPCATPQDHQDAWPFSE